MNARRVLLGGLSDEATERLHEALPKGFAAVVPTAAEAEAWLPQNVASKPPVLWGRNHLGVGLLTAMRNGTWIKFDDAAPTQASIVPTSDHLVVCEAGKDLSEWFTAANYASRLAPVCRSLSPFLTPSAISFWNACTASSISGSSPRQR